MSIATLHAKCMWYVWHDAFQMYGIKPGCKIALQLLHTFKVSGNYSSFKPLMLLRKQEGACTHSCMRVWSRHAPEKHEGLDSHV